MDPNEARRRLVDAKDRSPELAAILAADREASSGGYRRLAAIVGAAALAIGGLWFAVRMRAPSPEKPQEPAEEVDRSVYLPPIKTEKVAPGEESAPFVGFAVTVETVPPGALVSIGGKVRGEAPVLASLECRGTEKVEVRAEKAGFRIARRELACRDDTLVKLTLLLEK
jgi:hypothetical protein